MSRRVGAWLGWVAEEGIAAAFSLVLLVAAVAGIAVGLYAVVSGF